MPGLPTIDELLQFLRATPPFLSLNPVDLAELIHLKSLVSAVEGSHIFEAGDPGDAWYLLYCGEVEVIAAGKEKSVRTMGPGSIFGELALLDGGARTASVRASAESVLLRFDTEEFHKLLESGSPAAAKLLRALATEAIAKHRLIVGELGTGNDGKTGG